MRFFAIVLISCSLLFTAACTSGGQINGRNFKTALKSVNRIKDRLPQNQRVAFELSFWSLRTLYRKNKEFLGIVHGATPDELIQLGKEAFDKRRAEGFEEYQQYSTWGEMIAKYTDERNSQNVKHKRNPSDAQNNLNYKL